MNKRLFFLVVGLLLLAPSAFTQDTDPVPTLIPPTRVPSSSAGADEPLLDESGVARIQRDGLLRVGILFNEPPFGELNIRGTITGFDADLARSMAEAWGVDVEFKQVTRQTAFDMLDRREVDLLIAAQAHRRELDSEVEFSQTYYVGSQAMLVRSDDNAEELDDLAFRDRPIGVVLGSRGAEAVASWLGRVEYDIPVTTYLTLDRAYVALVEGDVDGVVAGRERLRQVITQLDLVRFLAEPVQPQPYAVAMPRQDVNLRNLVNRTLQYLLESGRMAELHREYFPDETFAIADYPVWSNVGEDPPTPAGFPTNVPYPAQYAAPRLLSEGVIRVAGMTEPPPDAPESARRLATLNRAIMDAMAARWGLRVEYSDAPNPLEALASGAVDLAVGVTPDWDWANRVDFTNPSLLHGERLMVKTDSDIQSFNDLRSGRWIAIDADEPGVRDRAVAWAESVNVFVEFYQTRASDLAFSMLVDNNADVAYADSLKLIQHLEANPDQLQLTDRWYSRSYVTFATPRNDLDFRLLVEYTLQELARDGALASLIAPLMPPDETPAFVLWPGPGDYLGLSLGS